MAPKPKSIYQEALEMVAGALVIYIFADIRELAREGKLDGMTIDDLQAPLTAEQTLAIILANKDKLEEMAINNQDVEDLLKAMKHMQIHHADDQDAIEEGASSGYLSNIWNTGIDTLLTSKTGSKMGLDKVLGSFMNGKKDPPKKKSAKSAVMTNFVDDNSKEEIVHAIVVNQDRKRVSVVFRGSATPKDFIQDAKMSQKKIPNPVKSMMEKERTESMPETINVHTGFYQYLFQMNKETKKTRIETIMEDVKTQLKENPGFQLYVTGHSLGGALSTMYGFFAAADDEMIELSPNGVIVYSVASPFVGNWKWRFAFQELERRKRLQHLRIQNAEDMVTLMPFAVPKAGFFMPILAVKTGAGNLYKHVGMRLKLAQKAKEESELPYSISYPVDQRMDDEEFTKDVQDTLDQGKSLMKAFKAVVTKDFERVERYHSCTEYEERLEKCRDELTGITLDELYADTKIVGSMMEKDYMPKNGGVMSTAFRAMGLGKKKSDTLSSSEMVEEDDE
ncbi:unnamed protein product [Cylindrotheca closterium]|uniref:Fungal lipase-type domain-containing protein n=1 Tax=Cylindrotheca closterium TaxID=2856 RepID=A0AAD2CQ32_9STRA|nr:unnamed protein product [Cylindrotheca closterium]